MGDSQKPAINSQLPADLISGRQTWVEVDLRALRDNYKALESLLAPGAISKTQPSIPHPRIIPVVKANAYGHGAVAVASALADAGATILAVGVVEEGAILRRSGISQDIIVLGTSWAGQESVAIENRLILAVDAPEGVHRLEVAAKKLAASATVHVKVDTGMGRLGVHWNAMGRLLKAIRTTKYVSMKGVFSHLSSADETDDSYTLEQMNRFEHSLSTVRESNLDPGEIHLANSAGLLYHEGIRRWSARTGISLYGYSPDPQRSPVKLRPILSLKTKIGPIRNLKKGDPVGYNRRFVASEQAQIATLPVGYADGFNHRLSGRGRVIIKDRWSRIAGAVSMDMTAVDLTNMPNVREGDEVILLGESSNCRMTAEEWADILGTIPYEILCGIASRVPRFYLNNN
jgi:alanine racemase